MIKPTTCNALFHRKPKSIQYSTGLVIVGTIRSTLHKKLNQELCLETLQFKQWFRKLCLLFKIIINQSHSYFFDYVPSTDNI